MDGVSASSGEASASPQHKALCISLLGALAYTLLTHIDSAVCIAALQRVAQAPLNLRVKRLNAVTRWAQRNPQGSPIAALSNQCVCLVSVTARSS
eukprot:2690512-Lingulodinium_polyedra.AAC.1